MIKDAIVMCGGNGLGLWPLTETTPKPLIKILGKSILYRILDGLKKAGIKNAYFVTFYLEDKLITEAKKICKEIGIKPFIIHQKSALGTADAVKCAKEFLKNPFLVVSGDHVLDISIYEDLVKEFKGDSVVLLKKVPNPSNYGVSEVKDGIITAMIEKPKVPKTDLANIGIYAFNTNIFNELEQVKLSERNEYEITDVLKGKKALITQKYWIDVGLPWVLLDSMDFLFNIEEEKNNGKITNSKITGKVIIEEGAVIENSTLEGTVYIGKNCKIKNSILKNSSIHENSVLDKSNVEDSLLGEKTKLDSCKINDSVLGNEISGENSILESKKNAIITTKKGEKTSPRIFGSVVGDKTTIKGIIDPGNLIN